MTRSLVLKQLGLQEYTSTWEAMQAFTQHRHANSVDEIWCLQHPAVFTQGLNGKAKHILIPSHIPVVQTDRGGQITYHGPGQLICYLLIDLKRLNLGVRHFVTLLEEILIDYLQTLDITAHTIKGAPGVYVANQKIASLGLKVRQHKTYHGLALNIHMDLSPFKTVNPCGLDDIQMTQIANLVHPDKVPSCNEAGEKLTALLQKQLDAVAD